MLEASTSGKGRLLRPFFVVTAAFSLAVNILLLVSPLYMLQVYDRVLTSGSIETLIWVSVAAIGLLLVYGFAESGRRQAMILASDFIARYYGPAIVRSELERSNRGVPNQPRLSDLSMVQSYYQNGLALPFFDLPYTPLFFLAMFMIHPIIGSLGLIGAVILILVTYLAERGSRTSVQDTKKAERYAEMFADELSRNKNAVVSMGMDARLTTRWQGQKTRADSLMNRLGSIPQIFGSHARGFRMMLQIGALGIGGWLVLQQELTAGAIIAGSILLGRALGPIDQSLAGWRHITKAREAWALLQTLDVESINENMQHTPLPQPQPNLTLKNFQIGVPGTDNPLLPKFSVTLTGGEIVIIIGSSGSGKSTLLNTLAGTQAPLGGTARLGGRNIHHWAAEDRGRYIGYVPQDIELLPGTILENISRFDEVDPGQVVALCEAIGVHDMIVRLPGGYDTKIGLGGLRLSKGQSQAVALARAYFGTPAMLLFDEPTSNIDELLYSRVNQSLQRAKEADKIIIIATHDPRLLSVADKVMLIMDNDVKMISQPDYLAVQMRLKRNSERQEKTA